MHLKNATHTYSTVFIGGGPAGTGPIICALQRGDLPRLLDTGIAVLDRSDRLCRGALGDYVINSDTLSDTFLECLREQHAGPLAGLLEAPSKRALDAYAGGPAPLALAGDFMSDLGASLAGILDRHPVSQFVPRATAQAVRALPDGLYETQSEVVRDDGAVETVTLNSRSVVVATGGRQSRDRVLRETVAGTPVHRFEDKVVLSDELLTGPGMAEVRRLLAQSGSRKVVIIGGSHSATSSAWVLLNKLAGVTFDTGDITILHRERLKLFYPSREAALAEGYTDFDDDDICPLTQRVYRLAGFRFDSRELLMRVWGMNGREPEKRVRLRRLAADGSDAADVRGLLDQAAVIVTAFGYRPAAVPFYDAQGQPIALFAQGAGAPPLVDDRCRVLDAHKQPIPNVYGIGLSSGFVPSGKLGGEPSFRGQTNGLWLYQNGVGEIVLDQILESSRQPA